MIGRRSLTKVQKEELERIRRKHHGVLKAEYVLREAESEDSSLHSRFCWDDTEAARRYRLLEAQMVVRLSVIILPGKGGRPIKVRTYVSLDPDREEKANHVFRATVDVLGDKEQRAALVATVLRELKMIQEKYEYITELAGVWRAIEKARSRRLRT